MNAENALRIKHLSKKVRIYNQNMPPNSFWRILI